MVWKPSPVQALAMVAAWFGSLFGSISVEAAVGSLDWPWYIHAGISLGFFVVAYGCVVLHNRRDWQSLHDGREVAKKIRLSLHDAGKERARYTGIHYYRSRFPWWKRVWARLRK